MRGMWKQVVGYPDYEVSDAGQVRRATAANRTSIGRELKPFFPKGKPYPSVCLRLDKKNYYRKVHVLVLEAFTGPRPPGLETRHLDGNATNNAAANLQWGTRAENAADKDRHGTSPVGERNPSVKLTAEQVHQIRAAPGGYRSIAKSFGVNYSTIRDIRKGWTWADQ